MRTTWSASRSSRAGSSGHSSSRSAYQASVAGAATLSAAARPIARRLGELAELLGRQDLAAEHLAEAAEVAVAERWRTR